MLILVYTLTSLKLDTWIVYEDIYAEMVYSSKFDKNSDLTTTYLGKADMTRNNKIKAEERFPITGQGLLQQNY